MNGKHERNMREFERLKEVLAKGKELAEGGIIKDPVQPWYPCDPPPEYIEPFALPDAMLNRVHADAVAYKVEPNAANMILVSLTDEVKRLRAQLAEAERHEAQWKETALANMAYADDVIAQYGELQEAGMEVVWYVEQHGIRKVVLPAHRQHLFRMVTRLADAVRRPIQLVKTYD